MQSHAISQACSVCELSRIVNTSYVQGTLTKFAYSIQMACNNSIILLLNSNYKSNR